MLLYLWRLIYSSWDLRLHLRSKQKSDKGYLHSKKAPTVGLVYLIDDMPSASTFLLSHMVQSIWPPACRCSQCGGFAKVPGFLHQILIIWLSDVSTLLSPLDTFVSFQQPWVCPNSSKSFSSASLGHIEAFVAVHKLWSFISSSSTVSALYISRNGIKLVALHTIVLWLHTAFGMTPAHFFLFALEYFLDCYKYQGVSPLYCTIGLRVIYRCEGDLCSDLLAKKSLNITLSKYFVLSTVMCQWTP
jgi:hypothetical protein